jgi:hypothetical protein
MELYQALGVLMITLGVALFFVVARLYDRYLEEERAKQLEELDNLSNYRLYLREDETLVTRSLNSKREENTTNTRPL